MPPQRSAAPDDPTRGDRLHGAGNPAQLTLLHQALRASQRPYEGEIPQTLADLRREDAPGSGTHRQPGTEARSLRVRKHPARRARPAAASDADRRCRLRQREGASTLPRGTRHREHHPRKGERPTAARRRPASHPRALPQETLPSFPRQTLRPALADRDGLLDAQAADGLGAQSARLPQPVSGNRAPGHHTQLDDPLVSQYDVLYRAGQSLFIQPCVTVHVGGQRPVS